jgi:Zn-dependent protease
MSEEKKIYKSFHDIPPRDYMYFPKGSLDAGKPGKFSRIEISHILISMAVLVVAFSFAITRNNLLWGLNNGFDFERLPTGLLLSFLGVVTAFFFHEIAHKFMAQRHGLWSEYRMFPQGLLIALFLGILTGFVFAAPGAVMFRGGARNHETGKIAVSGPSANIVIACVTLLLYLFVFFEDPILGSIVGFICYINAFLATFNLLPFGPLDGSKIIRWNATAWIILLIIAITTLVLIFTKFDFSNMSLIF